MSKNCSIMKRMKANYEVRSRTELVRRMPVILRIDGKAFHTYTRGLDKPFDEGLMEDMIETTKYLCSKIQGAKCGYVQSDEISILITDYDSLQTDAWFDYQVQKMCSVAASMAASKFNLLRIVRHTEGRDWEDSADMYDAIDKLGEFTLADFDCRAFNIPKEEVANYFLARQKDAVKNSISMLAQSLYSHKELHGKNQADMQDMCWDKGHNWNHLHFSKKRGTFVVKEKFFMFDLEQLPMNLFSSEIGLEGQRWKLDGEGPYFPTAVRSKWTDVETPVVFNETHFKDWL